MIRLSWFSVPLFCDRSFGLWSVAIWLLLRGDKAIFSKCVLVQFMIYKTLNLRVLGQSVYGAMSELYGCRVEFGSIL
jgi:hypothetical protein